jgi:hypothetical protein
MFHGTYIYASRITTETSPTPPPAAAAAAFRPPPFTLSSYSPQRLFFVLFLELLV